MATTPKVPNVSVPVVDASGRMTPDWYRFFAQLAHVGAVDVAVGAAGAAAALPATPKGYHTEWINGEQVLVPHYARP